MACNLWPFSAMADFRNTLFIPFENEHIDGPVEGQKWAFLNADAAVGQEWKESLICQQNQRPGFLKLEKSGFDVHPHLSDFQDFDGVLILATRVRKLNEQLITRAWNALKPGGTLIFSGDKTSGVQPIRKWFSKHAPLGGSLSKHHGVVFWASRSAEAWAATEELGEINGYRVSPGMFSVGGIDKGSKLLAEHFDDRIFGKVGDFGAGWGFLSDQLLKRSSRVENLSLYEAHWPSLEAARMNVPGADAFHWTDIVTERPRGPFNWIIMNPPFHKGRAAEPELGQIFIQHAAKALPAGGRLLMVANTNLPYERTLSDVFKKVERRDQANGFKVIEAVK